MWNENLQLLDCLFRRGFFFVLPVPVGLGSPFTTSLYKRHFADEDLSIPELSQRNKRNETDVNYTCNLQKVWDSSDSLNGNSCSLFIFIRSTIPMISGDFLTWWNAITVRKGREKGQFLGISYFWMEVLGRYYLTQEHLHSQPFKLILLPYGNTAFSILFCCCCFVYTLL